MGKENKYFVAQLKKVLEICHANDYLSCHIEYVSYFLYQAEAGPLDQSQTNDIKELIDNILFDFEVNN
ncbi:hypothetical protein [Nitrosospira sp. NRS527]|uniref:hypothetical protein n=1 Tax=Nitrosospira sp. NRS527 TaxID=155925 RepID=UPI001AF3EF30|nr:hypothetical protein [Nitrosospira sp. NRS527]BCT69487.1 hypothetical protein NNRS527_03111 [Nitrosospira sp. NRS527]